jgi:hypothetical protein
VRACVRQVAPFQLHLQAHLSLMHVLLFTGGDTEGWGPPCDIMRPVPLYEHVISPYSSFPSKTRIFRDVDGSTEL